MEKDSTTTIEFGSLDYYSLTTHKLILKLAGKNSAFFLNDTERFGEIMEEIMMADWLWNGQGSMYGYRKVRAKWAICRIYDRVHKDKEKNFESLDNMAAINLYAEDSTLEVDNMELCNNIKKLITDNVISNSEKFCIEQYYLNDKSADCISQDISSSKQTVFNKIKSGCKKINKHLQLGKRDLVHV